MRVGPWYARGDYTQHYLSRSDTVVGLAWPVIPSFGWLTVTQGGFTDRDLYRPGRVALPAVVYMPSDDSLRFCAVDPDYAGDQDTNGHWERLRQAKTVLVQPEVLGGETGAGYGVPLWVTWQSLSTEPLDVLVESPTSEARLPSGYTTLRAPVGRGDDAYNWYLGRTLGSLDQELRNRGLTWPSHSEG